MTLFADPRPLNAQTDVRYGVSLEDYGHLASVLMLPVAHIECAAVARHLPLAFLREGGEVVVCAVLGLRPGRTIVSRLGEIESAAQPLLLKAFPLGHGPRDGEGRVPLLVDAAPPSAGETMAVFQADGSLVPPLLDKADALWLFASAEPAGRAMLKALDQAGAFAAWDLRLVFEDGVAPVLDLLTVAPGFCEGPAYMTLLRRFGSDLAELVEHHLLSKARVSWLAALDEDIGLGRTLRS